MAESESERFTVWGGRITGIIGLVVVAVVVLLGATGIADPYAPVVYPVCGLVGLLLWSATVRPAAAVTGDQLVLRGSFSDVHVPLAAIEQVAVRQWLAVQVGDRRFTCAGVSRSRRQALRDDQRGADAAITDLSFGGFVESRIQKLAADARERQGVALYSDEQATLAATVRRAPARAELGLLAALCATLVVTLFV